MKLTGRFAPFVSGCVRATLILLAIFGSTSSAADTHAVSIKGLPGVAVSASVLSSNSTGPDVPDPALAGWQPLSQPLGQGFGDQVYWVRLVIDVPAELLDTPMVLRFNPPNARDVSFYLPDGSSIALGTEAPFEQRMLGFADLAASFMPTASPTIVHVRLGTAGRMFGSFELMSEQSYFQSQAWRIASHGVLYGMLLLALLVNVVNWATSRQSIYGLYVGFVGFSLLASLAANGYLHAFELVAQPEHHSTVQLWAFAGMAATAIAFAGRMVRLRAWHNRLEKAADLLAVTVLVMVLPASLWVGWRPYVWEFVLAAFFVYGMGSLVASLRNWWKAHTPQNTLLAVAFLVFAVSQWVSMGTVFGLLPATPVNVGMWQIGLVIHLVLLQMALVINRRQSRWRDWQQQARLDALKEQADTEARRSRDLQRFLERLTHEFKTPLAVIDSSVQSLGMLEQESDPQRDLRYERIRRAVARLNDLLMRSVVAEQATLNRPKGKRQRLELTALLEAVLAEFTSSAFTCDQDCVIRLDQGAYLGLLAQRHVRLTWRNIRRPESLLIDAEPSWLDAALYHVFDNAVKYSVGEDDITIDINQARPDSDSPSILISVTNSCDETLSDADLPRLFEKYYRKGEQGNVPGAGIGLYVARQAIHAHGGTLTARLLKHGQMQFQIELPAVIREP